MKYILKSSKEIFITYLLSYLIIILVAAIYTLFGYKDLTTFINSKGAIILIIFYILTTIYLYKKNYKKENSLPKKSYLPLIILGTSIACFLNMIIFLLYPPKTIVVPDLITSISSSIIGPIYEEILFRYILYNRLKDKYSITKSIIITTIIFAIIHLSPIKIVYAFILGIILNIAYNKYNNIIAPILIHISANSIVLLLHEYNTYIFLLSIICLLLSIKINTNIKMNNR